MPCDTVYETTAIDLGKVDQRVLKASLEASGWRVQLTGGGLVAYSGDRSLAVTAAGAKLTARAGTDTARVVRRIATDYARLAATQTAARFGFRKLGETTLKDGSVKLSFQRTMGAGASAKLGKVGL